MLKICFSIVPLCDVSKTWMENGIVIFLFSLQDFFRIINFLLFFIFKIIEIMMFIFRIYVKSLELFLNKFNWFHKNWELLIYDNLTNPSNIVIARHLCVFIQRNINLSPPPTHSLTEAAVWWRYKSKLIKIASLRFYLSFLSGHIVKHFLFIFYTRRQWMLKFSSMITAIFPSI